MSAQSKPQGRGRDQQTLADIATSVRARSFPDDIIIRYESNEALEVFIQQAGTLITYVLLNFSDAKKLLEEDGTLYGVLHPSQTPIISAAEEDWRIYGRQYRDIWTVLEACQPAIYIPDAGKMYVDSYGRVKQRAALEEYEMRLKRVMDEVTDQGWDIQVLPIAKGIHRWHLEELKPCYQKYGFQNYVAYCRQFYGGGRGNRINLLEEYLQNIVDVLNADNVFALGCHGPTHLGQFPPQVTGAGGIYNFATHCKLEDGTFGIEQFKNWRSVRRDKLSPVTLEGF